MDNHFNRSPEHWAKIEADEHDKQYMHSFPFGLSQYEFSVDYVLWYEDYAFKKGRRKDRGHRTRKILELIDLENIDGKRIMDIGCGNGQYSVLLAKKGGLVTGVELSPVGVEVAQRIAEANGVTDKCNFIVGDFTKQDFPEEYFDIVLMHEVYHHAIKYPGLKEKVRKITKPGGKIILADTVRGSAITHMGRKIVKYFRYRDRQDTRKHDKNRGDVLLSLDDYEKFAEGFSYHKIYTMSYLYMIKQTRLQYHVDKAYVRGFLRLVKYTDDVLLTLFPFLRKGCGEAILYIEK